VNADTTRARETGRQVNVNILGWIYNHRQESLQNHKKTGLLAGFVKLGPIWASTDASCLVWVGDGIVAGSKEPGT